jgi:hypothetical protein
MTSDLRGPKSLTSTQYIDKENEEATKPQTWIYWQVAGRDHDSAIHQHTRAGRQTNERKNNSETHRVTKRKHFIKHKYLQEIQSSPIDYQAKDGKVYYINSKEKKLQEKAKFYATSAAGSVVVEGAEESAAALGGGIEELGAGVEELGIGVEEAAEGVIIDTMPGVYSFAFLKNPSSSDRGRAREELIFSHSITSPCD